jgi:uncharacterized protein YndB with AHSA1/START domain
MKTLKYSIQIDKPRKFVFKKIMDKSIYPQWAKAWGEGMTYEGQWEKGKHIAFFDNSQGGTKVIVEDILTNEYIKMKHIAMVDPETIEVELSNDMMKKWIGSLEQYYFHEDGKNQTTLEVIVKTDEAFEKMMSPWSKALQYFKEVCELI